MSVTLEVGSRALLEVQLRAKLEARSGVESEVWLEAQWEVKLVELPSPLALELLETPPLAKCYCNVLISSGLNSKKGDS